MTSETHHPDSGSSPPKRTRRVYSNPGVSVYHEAAAVFLSFRGWPLLHVAPAPRGGFAYMFGPEAHADHELRLQLRDRFRAERERAEQAHPRRFRREQLLHR